MSGIVYLKNFLFIPPPPFKISQGCCDGAKKQTAHAIEKKYIPDLNCQGIRKSEGGVRSTAYKSCFDKNFVGCDKLRPIFWLKNNDKKLYHDHYLIQYSDAYRIYGLSRTGCVGCPFGKDFEKELIAAEQYEPSLYKAAINVFKESYEYTRKYREFVKNNSEKDNLGGRYNK